MKTIILFTVCALLIVSCSKCGDNQLCGTWRLVQANYSGPDFELSINENSRICYKILSEQHFSVVEMYPQNPDSFFFAAVGTYSLNDTSYVETYEASNMSAKVGEKVHFHSIVEGDKWRIRGADENLKINETWIRVAKAEFK